MLVHVRRFRCRTGRTAAAKSRIFRRFRTRAAKSGVLDAMQREASTRPGTSKHASPLSWAAQDFSTPCSRRGRACTQGFHRQFGSQKFCLVIDCATGPRVSMRFHGARVPMRDWRCSQAGQRPGALWITALRAGTMHRFVVRSPASGQTHRSNTAAGPAPIAGQDEAARHDRHITTMRSRHRRRMPAAPSAVGGTRIDAPLLARLLATARA